MVSKTKAPDPPDPNVTAQAQTESNQQTAITQALLNNINQVTPFGNLTFDQIGTFEDGTPQFQATTTLGEDQQAIFDEINRLTLARLGGDAGGLGTAVDTSDPALGQAISDRFLPRLNESLDERRRALEAQLVNQGFQRGSEGFNNALRDFNQVETDARNQIQIQARNQALQEILGGADSNRRDLNLLLTGGQAVQPGFQPTAQTGVAGTDVAGIINNNFNQQLANFQQANNARNSVFGALAGLGSSIAGFALSDRRAKENIKEVGELKDGTPIYSYKYKGAGGLTQLGVMAQEVEKTNPDAVQEFDGLKHVDYDAVTDKALEAG